MKEKWFLVPYAYDFIDEKRGTGSGTMARINALLKNIRWRELNPQDCIAILCAGYSKENPSLPAKGQPAVASLAYQQVRYLLDKEPNLKALSKPMCWGTWYCTEHIIERIQMYLSTTRYAGGVHVLVSTNTEHMPRVKLCWYYMMPTGWDVSFVPAIHNFSILEVVREKLLYIQYLWKIMKYENSHRTYSRK